MSRSHREWTDRFSDYLAGELADTERAEVEAHLAECGGCRAVLGGLRDVVARAAALEDLEPPQDLWTGLASAIGAPGRVGRGSADRHVIALPSAGGGVRSRVRRRSSGALGPVRLAAAAAALVVVSVGTTWWVARTGAAVGQGAAGPNGTPAEAALAADTGTPPADLAGELAALEELLEAARGTLDPNTVLVLERNLGVIERAIADSREALAVDPGNPFLTEHLERMYRRKLVYLQDAVRVVQWSG